MLRLAKLLVLPAALAAALLLSPGQAEARPHHGRTPAAHHAHGHRGHHRHHAGHHHHHRGHHAPRHHHR
ncbi:MAG TPA: hypothetical protein VL426_04700 [Candidatus Binatia bacterium]|nr:hypothetical protein [Candidatus Binatia bacterium]